MGTNFLFIMLLIATVISMAALHIPIASKYLHIAMTCTFEGLTKLDPLQGE